LLEVGQYFIPGRSFSFLDIAANTLGVALGFFLGGYLKSRLSRKEICFPR